MRYRMEMIDGNLVVRHVQTDRITGTIRWYADPNIPGAPTFGQWLVYDANGEAVEWFGARGRTSC